MTQQLALAEQAAVCRETVQAFCERLHVQLVEPSFALKQQVLRLVVERITVTDDEIVIQHIIPMDSSSRLYLRPSQRGEAFGKDALRASAQITGEVAHAHLELDRETPQGTSAKRRR